MKTRNFVLSALGLAAAITIGGAEQASAQGRSQKRIPVRKETPKEEAKEMMKPDTVYIRTKPDTIMMRGRTDTVTVRMRPDTVMQMQMLPLMKLPSVYFGLGAGVAVPMNHFRDFIHDGLDLNAQLGFFPGQGAIGIRFDGNYATFARRKTDCPLCKDTKLASGMADLVLRLPLDRYSHINPVIYLMAGGGIDHFSNFNNYTNTEGKLVTAGANGSDTKYDYNVGAGIDYTLLGLHLFNEGRYVTINTTGGNTHYWPILMGLKFY
ncbi:MAG: hypothetical protein M3Z05_22000 [Gemmatimonadota bacterium]|nr:hypothetical protein [Gemmatimonadota bacterium]